jgi:hypothetical protein
MEQFSYLERFKKKTIPKNRKGIFVVNPIKESEKEKEEAKVVEKEEATESDTEEEETEESGQPKDTEGNEEEPEKAPKEAEENKEPEEKMKLPQFEIIDKRKGLNNKINRMNILKHIREIEIKPAVEPEPEPVVITQPEEPNKLNEIVAEPEAEPKPIEIGEQPQIKIIKKTFEN